MIKFLIFLFLNNIITYSCFIFGKLKITNKIKNIIFNKINKNLK